MTESTKRRALNVFAAMGTIPDAYVTAAEDALYEAEAGIRRPVRPIGPVRRFLNSGWGAAVISGIVALTVLFLIIRAGQNPPVHGPNKPPSGSSIPMSDEGADFTISTEEAYYRANTNRITVIMTGVTPGKAISMTNAWYLEWLTDEGAKAVEIYYTEEAIESAKPPRNQYATISKYIHINDAKGYALQPGTYRLHATVYNGEEYVSVAWCEFEVGEPEMETTIICDGAVFHYDPYAVAVPFTVTTDAKIPFGTGRIRLTVTAEEPMVSLFEQPIYWHIQREDGYVHTPVGSWAVTDTSPETYIQTGPTEEDVYARYTVSITLPVLLDEWEPGTYRVYALTEPLSENNVYAASCTFTILELHETIDSEVSDEASSVEGYSLYYAPKSVDVPFTVSVEPIVHGDSVLTVTVTATEAGVSMIDPPRYWFIQRDYTGEPWGYTHQNSDKATWIQSAVDISEVHPAEEGGHATFTDTITLLNPEEWQPGQYILYALSAPFKEENKFVDSCYFFIEEAPAE